LYIHFYSIFDTDRIECTCKKTEKKDHQTHKKMGAEAIATGIVIVITASWIAWISLSTIQNQSRIDKLSSLGDQFDNLRKDIGGVNNRLDIFIKNELDVLKEIAEKE
jgi:heme/copper-type cytochrome/quinol oxidase subunit 2